MVNQTPYTGIQPFKYKPKTKALTIKEQRLYFVKIVQRWVNDNPDKHPAWFLNDFVSADPEKGYWNIVPDNKTKTNYFLLPKKQREKWSTGGRLATAKNFKRNDPRWKLKPDNQMTYTPPKNLSQDNFKPDYEAYKQRMEKQNKEVKGDIAKYLPHNRK
jgi:hypothetical protein